MKTKYIVILFMSLIFVACESSLDIKPLKINIELLNKEVKVGEAAVFAFDGEADYVIFYSGEEGRKYEHKDRVYIDGGRGLLSFFSRTFHHHKDSITMRMYVSTDFSGDYNVESIEKANWTELTEEFIWPKDTTVELFSGELDISEHLGEKPICIAFQYIGKSGIVQPAWIIRDLKLIYETEEKIYPFITNMSEADFKFVYYEEKPTRKWIVTNKYIQMKSAKDVAPDYSSWAITKSFFLNKIESDLGAGVMDMINKVKEFRYVYEQAGEYNVVFLCRNANVKGEIVEIKEFKIKVTE